MKLNFGRAAAPSEGALARYVFECGYRECVGEGHDAATEERNSRLAGHLRRHAAHEPRAFGLAATVADCTIHRPCISGACPTCGEAAQHGFAAAVHRFVDEHRRRDTVVCAGIALWSLAVPRGGLAGLDLPAARRRVQARLTTAGIGWATGAWDYSFNEHETGRYEPFWLPHLHLILATDESTALRRGLRDAFVRTDAIPRPVKVQAWDGRENALLYLLKMKYDRRVGVDGAERFSPKTGEWRRCRATSQQRLRSAERLELLLHLDEIGLDGRLFMRRAQLRRTRDGLTIVAMP
jgi:hypothetical protein